MKTRLFLPAALMLVAGGFALHAVDPLPAHLEKASLEKQAEYWQRTSKESSELRTKVAQQRYQEALKYKRVLQNQMEDNLARVEARQQPPAAAVGAGADTGAATAGVPPSEDQTSWGLYALLAGMLLFGGVFISKQMKASEQPV